MSPSARRVQGALFAGLVALLATACGSSGASPGASAVAGRYPVAVRASLPAHERIAGRVAMTVRVRNTGSRALPDVAVSVCPHSCAPSDRANEGTSAQAFGYDIQGGPTTADPSRPLWIVLRGPGGCRAQCNASGGDLGGGVSSNSDTWALGRLPPGHTATFTWALAPVVAGRFAVAWQVDGDLSGRAHAVSAAGGVPQGVLHATIAARPVQVRVTPSGRVVPVRASH